MNSESTKPLNNSPLDNGCNHFHKENTIKLERTQTQYQIQNLLTYKVQKRPLKQDTKNYLKDNTIKSKYGKKPRDENLFIIIY